MAINAAKQLLDELMGRSRDLAPQQKQSMTIHWNDLTVCKHYLVNFCPNSLFTNTKADIGPCNLVHDDYVKREYQSKASRKDKIAFEDEFMHMCQSLLSEVEKKIKRAKQRLEMSQTESGSATEVVKERLKLLNEKIEKMIEEVEQLGCEGKVEEAQAAMKQLEKIKEEKAAFKRECQRDSHWLQHKAEMGVAQEKQMEVCDVCGAFLIVNDVQQRVEDHLMGKQHQGYGRLKSALDELLEKRKRTDSNESSSSSSTRNERDRGNERKEQQQQRATSSRESDRTRDRDRYRDRRDRARVRWHKSHRSRERSRSRSREKYNSRHGFSNGR